MLRVTDALATVEEMACRRSYRDDDDPGSSSSPVVVAPFDMVFVDADKGRLLDYVEACVDSDRLLRRGGLILVDNVLWKGMVLEAADAGGKGGRGSRADEMRAEEEKKEEEENGDGGKRRELRKSRRARKLAGIMHRFNEAVSTDPRLEVVLLPLRDGLSIIRKR